MAARHEVLVADSVVDFILDNVYSKRVYEHILECIELLGDYPEMGRVYDSEFPTARPPFACRCLPVGDTPFTLFYTNDDDAAKTVVFCIVFSAGDPRDWFSER